MYTISVGLLILGKLDYWQKNMASELYDEFGDGSFTSSMIFAKLEYKKDRAIATLHTFSMMGILGTDLDAISRAMRLSGPMISIRLSVRDPFSSYIILTKHPMGYPMIPVPCSSSSSA